MKTYLFYTTGASSQDQTQALTDQLTKLQVETINLDADSVEGARLSELYDMTMRPGAVITRDDGQMIHRWLGVLPNASDVSYYVNG
ncbi:MAG TPA: hypothetical protein VLE72_00995 [Candidatus Saccharimonadales bacterium]|nr:hypothetical protein [Candidatus Saccharimonadales bacterium]